MRKLDTNAIAEIRRIGPPAKQHCEKYGVSHPTIYRVLNGQSYMGRRRTFRLKLTEDQIKEVRSRKLTTREYATLFGVAQSTIVRSQHA